MAFEDWDQRDGQIATCPLTGWEIANFHTVGLVRLRFVESEAQLRTEDHGSLQLAISAPQLRELAQALTRLADLLDGHPKGTRQ